MTNLIAICLVLIVLELGAMIAVFAIAMVKVRDAAQAIEVAAYRADQEVEHLGASMRTGLAEGIKTLLSFILSLLREKS